MGLAYFDATDDTSDSNLASCIIPLEADSRVERRAADGKGPAAQFALVTSSPEYLFGVASDAEAEAWVQAITKRMGANVQGAGLAADISP